MRSKRHRSKAVFRPMTLYERVFDAGLREFAVRRVQDGYIEVSYARLGQSPQVELLDYPPEPGPWEESWSRRMSWRLNLGAAIERQFGVHYDWTDMHEELNEQNLCKPNRLK